MLAVALALLLSWAGPLAAQRAERADPAADRSGELVVLVHGMGRTAVSMLPLELALESAGYRVHNFSYSSYGPSVPEIAGALREDIDARLLDEPATRVHFVGHSLGNIVIRWHLTNHATATRPGRFVMLTPPNRGSHVADTMSRYFSWLFPPLEELRTSGSTAANLPDPKGVEYAIIAAARDDKVSLGETCLGGAAAHALVEGGHTFVMARPDVIRMVRHFLETGAFPESTHRAVRCFPSAPAPFSR